MNRSERPISAEAFLVALSELGESFAIELHAFCLLPRHYHLLVRAEDDDLLAGLGRLERACGFAPARPPHVVPVGFGRHLILVSRYIHLDPVEAGLSPIPEGWPHSSFHAYLCGLLGAPWLTTEAVLGLFGAIGARHRHRAFVYAGLATEGRDRDGRPCWRDVPAGGASASDRLWRIEPVLRVGALPGGSGARGFVAHHVDLPEVPGAGPKEGGHGQLPGRADAPLEVVELFELCLVGGVEHDGEARLTHHQ